MLPKSCLVGLAVLLMVAPLVATSASAADLDRGGALRHAHAHNDYYHDRPLFDALDRGFTSVEADVYRVDGELLVGHDRHELRRERSLASLYLDPLKDRVEKNGGHVHEPGTNFYLFIDIKDDAARTRKAIGELLGNYVSMVGSSNEEGAPPPAVTVVLSGSAPRRGIVVNGVRLAGADGRLSDLDSEESAAEMPVISDHWGQNFGGPRPDQERLRTVTRKARESGRIVRLWATPDSEQLWATLLDNDVNLINTDDLDRLTKFLKSREAQTFPSP